MNGRIALLMAVLLVVPAQARASTAGLRTAITVRGETVRLSDLFVGLQPGQDCDIGPSPSPGKRIVIPPLQLAAIASEFGVDWQPGAAYQSATLKRLGRVVTREEIAAVLRPALVGNGASPDSDLSLAAFVSPILPVEMTAPPEVQTLDFEPQTGRFSATLLFAGPASDGVAVRIAGRAEQQVSVIALTHALPAGSLLLPSDLQTTRIRLNSLHGTPVTLAAEAQGLALRRPLGIGMPLLRDMLVRPMLIDRGRPVILRLQTAGLQLTAAGIALEGGTAGDRIHVVNSLSHAVLVGQITNGAEIQIDPGTAPVVGQAIGGQNGLPKVTNELPGGARGLAGYAQEAQNR